MHTSPFLIPAIENLSISLSPHMQTSSTIYSYRPIIHPVFPASMPFSSCHSFHLTSSSSYPFFHVPFSTSAPCLLELFCLHHSILLSSRSFPLKFYT
ncbi:hypothetical protein XENTR_v10002475 [Xenopus tropicalis]|nr:hypothetical protein XENTR_v10002475 [Xenopus tropicalis]